SQGWSEVPPLPSASPTRSYSYPPCRTPPVPVFSPTLTDLITPVPHRQTPAPSTRHPFPPGPIQ
ncbi:hypothetical protein P7K49_038758, partial [Saguinus oedipus]